VKIPPARSSYCFCCEDRSLGLRCANAEGQGHEVKYLIILFILTFAATLSAECAHWNSQTDTPPAQELAAFLEQKDVLANQPDCAIAALEILGHEHATGYIPQIVNFLTFKQKFYWEGTGFNIRPVTELGHYPAAMALFEIGKPALPALLAVATDEKPDSLKFNNAVSTIMLIHRDRSSGGVHFLAPDGAKSKRPAASRQLGCCGGAGGNPVRQRHPRNQR
jgi:hypothetical protein